MKITIPFQSFDLQSFLNAAADFNDGLCGEEFQAVLIATASELDEVYEMDWDDLPRHERTIRFPALEQALKAGETLVVTIASPYNDGEASLADGKSYQIDNEQEFYGGDVDAGVIFLDYSPQSIEITIETGMSCGGGCMSAPTVSRQSIGPLEKPAEAFVKRFVK